MFFFPKLKFWWPDIDIDWCYKTFSRNFTVVYFLLRKYATFCCTRSHYNIDMQRNRRRNSFATLSFTTQGRSSGVYWHASLWLAATQDDADAICVPFLVAWLKCKFVAVGQQTLTNILFSWKEWKGERGRGGGGGGWEIEKRRRFEWFILILPSFVVFLLSLSLSLSLFLCVCVCVCVCVVRACACVCVCVCVCVCNVLWHTTLLYCNE